MFYHDVSAACNGLRTGELLVIYNLHSYATRERANAEESHQ